MDTINSIQQILVSSALIHTAILLVIAVLVQRMGKYVVKKAISSVDDGDDSVDTVLEQRAKTIGSLVSNVVNTTIWGIVATMILSQWGINIAPILAGAGVVGLAVGFGAQSLVKDVVTGFFILFENVFNVGDTIKTAGVEGKVVDMKLRTTVLKDKEGKVHIVPNSKIDVITKTV